ncbi:MAG TPA: MFS transporter [Kribbella sp.]|nr:MFS transporter [Kribbella sp.]
MTARPSAARNERSSLVPTLVFLGVASTAVASLGAPLLATVVRVEHVSLAASQWTLTISLLVGAVVTPVLGRVGDGRRRKSVIVAVTAVVFVGCVLAALPTGFDGLLVGRALQGTGLALVPLATAAARDALPAERARPVAALLGVTTAVGIGVGYPIVGLVTEHLGMSMAFWFGAAVTGIALVAAARFVPTSASPAGRRVDVAGAALLATGTGALLVLLSEGEAWGWTSVETVLATATSVVLLAAWARTELSSSHPLVDLRVMRHRSVLAANGLVLLVGVGIYPVLSLVVRLVQTPQASGYGFGGSVVVAGAMLVPFSLASFVVSRAIAPALRRVRPEMVVAVSIAVLVLAMTTFLADRSSYVALVATMTLAGAGVGGVFAANPVQILAGAPHAETGSAMSVYQVVRTIGFSVGSALSATALVASVPAGHTLPTASGYHTASVVSLSVLVVAAVVAVWLALGPGLRRGRRPLSGDPGASPQS